MIIAKIILLLLIPGISSFVFANDSLYVKKIPADSVNIISHWDKLGLYIYSIRKFRTYELKNSNLGLKLKFEPNGQTNIGLGFNYKWMGLGIAVSMPIVNKDNGVYGETKRFDLQLNLLSRFYGVSAYYQNYRGFYLSNPQDYLNWKESFYPNLSDMQSTSTGLAVFYWLNNKNFSYKAAFLRNEVQKRSSGGFVMGAFTDIDIVYAPSGFIPRSLPDSLSRIFDFKGYSTIVSGISLGYAYTLVLFKKTFINLSLVPGIGYRNLSIWYITSNNKTKPGFTGSLKGRFSLGYEGKHFYMGLASIGGMESFKYEEVDISSTSGQIRFYVGKRFKSRNKN
jgi:hypothetical protein